MTHFLIKTWPDRFGEHPDQIAENKKTGQRPPYVSDEAWFGDGYYFNHCHWYDRDDKSGGHCNGRWRHDHQPQIMKWYWKGPGIILSPLGLAWEARWFIVGDILDRLGWYRLLERFGVDTSPR